MVTLGVCIVTGRGHEKGLWGSSDVLSFDAALEGCSGHENLLSSTFMISTLLYVYIIL